MEKIVRKLCNPKKLIILDAIIRLKSCNVSELSKVIGMDYKNTTRYVSEFEKKGIVKLNKQGNGKPTIIILK